MYAPQTVALRRRVASQRGWRVNQLKLRLRLQLDQQFKAVSLALLELRSLLLGLRQFLDAVLHSFKLKAYR